MLQDIPCLAETRDILRTYKEFGNDLQFIRNYMLLAESPHQFAACLIALRKESGDISYRASGEQCNAFLRQSIGLADSLYEQVVANLHRGYEKRVSKSKSETYNEGSIITNYGGFVEPSAAARSDARMWREQNGSNYVGNRFVQAKARGVTGYYWTGKNQNVVEFAK